ncbi:MAG: PAS domain S-box protein [Bacteroidales bacterium]
MTILLTVVAWGMAELGNRLPFGDPEIHRLIMLMALALTVALLLSLLIAGIGIQRLVLRKVTMLERAAARIRAGEMGVTSGLSNDGGEFGRLARTFDSMANALDQRMKSFQHTLRESELRFTQMAGAAPTGIFRLDPQMRLTYANPWFLRVAGRGESDLLGRSWLACVHPDDRPWVEEVVARARARDTELELRECRFVHPDGTVVWVLVRDTPERDSQGRICGRIGTVVDVTTLKQVTEALRDSEERFRKLARIAPVGIYRTDAGGACTYANDSLAAILGRAKHELKGRNWRTMACADAALPPADLDGQHEVRLSRPDGRDVWVLVNEITDRDLRGMPMGRIGIMTDITGQMLAREALRASEERFRVALKHSRVTVCAYDSDLRYAWMFNGPSGTEGAEGRRAADLYGGPGVAKLTALQREVMATGIGRRDTVTLECTGTTRVVDVWYEPVLDEGGRVNGLVGAAVDITDEVHLQRELIVAREQAERANEAKSRFLAAASHDLRQPFQAMRLFRAALSPYLTDPRADTVAAKLDEAMNAGEQLLNILLDVSTLEAGIVAAKPAPVSAFDLLARLAREFQPQVEGRGLSFKVMARPALIYTDPVLLERMLRNLLHNAVRYTEAGGILIGARRRGDRLVFQVVDTGIGIPESQQDKVFEDFYQVGNAGRDRAHGLGLGLSVVARMARLLDHPVALRSRPGHGSVFSVSVPLHPAEDRDQAAA